MNRLRGIATISMVTIACETDPIVEDALYASATETLGPSEAVVAADLNGDGFDTLALVSQGKVVWGEGQASFEGAVQRVASGDINGNGKEEILIATGMGRGQTDVPARVVAIGESGAEVIWERDGPRAQVSDLAVVDGRIWLATFADRWNVEGGWLTDGAFEPLTKVRMGMRQRPHAEGILIGRLYGPEPKSDGDLHLRTGTSETPLPSLRGVRALLVADLDGEPGEEAIVGDGWHHRYGKEADPRVAILSGPKLGQNRTALWLDGDYAAQEFELIGEGPSAAILVTGARGVWIAQRDALGWSATRLADVYETGNAAAVRTESGMRVAVSGSPTRLISLQASP